MKEPSEANRCESSWNDGARLEEEIIAGLQDSGSESADIDEVSTRLRPREPSGDGKIETDNV